MRSGTYLTFTLLTLTSCFIGEATDDHQLSSVDQSARVRGAIFTTLPDGSAVNHNIYTAKTDVYLDGGPSGGSPVHAAALAEGDYYLQVTDPSGKVLLSTDDISCRRIHVNGSGVISAAVGACHHVTGSDQDYAALGARTVQLMPYNDTPNPGGEYKAWVTPVGAYTGSGMFHGFVPSFSKTDNFKVRETLPPPVCGDGHVDSGEQCDDGNTANGDGCSATCTTEMPPPPCCGDGRLDANEQCDDGNTANGDGCSATCTTEAPPTPGCGDGHHDSGEQCDDGNTTANDGCSATCTTEVPPTPPGCGDGRLDSGEQCDDGNTTGGDGCSATCQLEVSWPPGDGRPDDGHLCDDCITTMGTNPEVIFVP